MAYTLKKVQKVIEEVFDRIEFQNTLTVGVFEARGDIFERITDLINKGVTETDRMKMVNFLIKECHYSEHEIRAAIKGNHVYHCHDECLKMFK